MNPCFTSFKATAHSCWFECEVADAEATEKPRAGTMVPLWRFFQAPKATELVAAGRGDWCGQERIAKPTLTAAQTKTEAQAKAQATHPAEVAETEATEAEATEAEASEAEAADAEATAAEPTDATEAESGATSHRKGIPKSQSKEQPKKQPPRQKQ